MKTLPRLVKIIADQKIAFSLGFSLGKFFETLRPFELCVREPGDRESGTARLEEAVKTTSLLVLPAEAGERKTRIAAPWLEACG